MWKEMHVTFTVICNVVTLFTALTSQPPTLQSLVTTLYSVISLFFMSVIVVFQFSFSGTMELLWRGFCSPWHANQGRNCATCTSPLTTPPAAVMASSYPPPFEGAGEVKEGFICPLCLKDLQSFYQLQQHYEEEHSGDDRHVKGQIKSEHSCTATRVLSK